MYRQGQRGAEALVSPIDLVMSGLRGKGLPSGNLLTGTVQTHPELVCFFLVDLDPTKLTSKMITQTVEVSLNGASSLLSENHEAS